MRGIKKSFRTIPMKALGFILVILVFVAAAKTVKVNKETPGREGPGSYYELKVLIPAGTKLEVVEQKKHWYKVKYNKIQVWISENALIQQTGRAEDPFATMALGTAQAEASSATIAAAIKGFWTRYSRTNKANLAELPVDGYDIPPANFEAFAEKRANAVSQDELLKKYKLSDKYSDPKIPYVKEQQSGYSIASSVAEGTLLENMELLTYIHSVGWYLAETTERPDIKYIFYILDTDRVNAISCPGGYIVLTRGLLKLLDNEAELAALLAHEMSHVIAGHGMREVYQDEARITADNAFSSLSKATGGSSEMEEELIAITNRAAAIARSPKLDEYEFEADKLALRYMARCGYDLNGLIGLLNKLKTEHDRNVDMFDLNYRNHPDIKKRLQLSEKEISQYNNYSGNTYTDSYRENMVF
ncbi:MAG: M48 family metalloprotease [Candidatus Latescibacteria bacterium]|nr:M48 family metalloprotease [Candidatus Latescibacterota bacterium]